MQHMIALGVEEFSAGPLGKANTSIFLFKCALFLVSCIYVLRIFLF